MIKAILQKMLLKQSKDGLNDKFENFILKQTSKSKEEIKTLYEDRLQHELNIINSMDYSSYF